MIQQKEAKMKAKRLSLDIISTLPQTIIETILCRLPVEEAARTSILSREWRYKWTKIPKLVFYRCSVLKFTIKDKDLSDIAIGRENMDMTCKLFYAIHQVLLLRQAPIQEFTLRMTADETCFEIDQIILHLSRNHALKKFKLDLLASDSYSLPLSIFSMHHLTELVLDSCDLVHQPPFNGFGSLTSLSLYSVTIPKKTLLHLLSNCPSLKSLDLLIHDEGFHGHKYPSIMDLFKCIPVIEDLAIWGHIIPFFIQDSVPQELPSSLINLKYFSLVQLGFVDGHILTFLGVLIKSSPNLEKLKLRINRDDDGAEIEPDKLEEYSNILEEYSDVWLEHLHVLKINNFRNLKLEMAFVKFILARSPNLKKVTLRIYMDDSNKELEMTKILLCAPRASPVEIVVDNKGGDYEE